MIQVNLHLEYLYVTKQEKEISTKREHGKAITHRLDTRMDYGAKIKKKRKKMGGLQVCRKYSNHELSSPNKFLNHFSQKQKHVSNYKTIKDLNEVGRSF